MGQQPGTDPEHPNRWQMDVHPTHHMENHGKTSFLIRARCTSQQLMRIKAQTHEGQTSFRDCVSEPPGGCSQGENVCADRGVHPWQPVTMYQCISSPICMETHIFKQRVVLLLPFSWQTP